MTNLFNNQTENASSEPITARFDRYHIIARGDFGGGTLTIEISDDGTNFIDSGVSFSTQGQTIFPIGEGYQLRATLSGAIAPDLHVIAAEMRNSVISR